MSVTDKVGFSGKAVVTLSSFVMIILCAPVAQAESEKNSFVIVKKEILAGKKLPSTVAKKLKSITLKAGKPKRSLPLKFFDLEKGNLKAGCPNPPCGNEKF